MNPAIVVTNVEKTFRRYHADRPSTIQEAVAKGLRRRRTIERFWALRDVSFTVEAGKTVGLIGSNGSGKSTLLRLVGGVGKPDAGRIDVRGRVGALLDLGAGFHTDLTGRENAILAGILNGLTRRQVLDRLEAIVDFAEIERALDNPIRTYSSGMLMRLAFSVAVHTEPEILLIDEVLSVGDISFQRKCLDRLEQFKAAGCSILLVSHVGRTIESFCDEAVWLNDGRLKAQGPTGDVVRQYAAHAGSTDSRAQESLSEPLPPAPGVEDASTYPVVSQPPVTVRTPIGQEVVIDQSRFGTQELEIRTVRVLDSENQPVTEIASGRPILIELDYAANKMLVAPIFCVAIERDDGLTCFNFHGLEAPMNLTAIQGPGRVAIHLARIDLNSGRYHVHVACYAQDWAYAYDHRQSACSFLVRGDGPKEAAMNVPHRWRNSADGAPPVAS